MKKINAILVTILLIIVGCGERKQSTEDFIVVDVTKNYSSKKELILQDFMDVEYIVLETNDDFTNQGIAEYIGEKFILVKNRINDGNIFVYDRSGKALRKINRKGQSGEEYIYIYGIALDENSEEMFINDRPSKKIVVYDLYGNFKRSFKHKEGGGSLYYTDMFNYDKDHLICYDGYNEESPFVLVSKQDGSITKEIKIPFKEKKAPGAIKNDEASGTTFRVGPKPYRKIITYNGNWILSELSSDTVYSFLPDYTLQPFLVRTPPVQSMDPEIFLMLRLFSDRYYFMETMENTFNFKTSKGFSKTFMAYDKQEKSLFNYTVFNSDYSIKKEIYMNLLRPVNHEIESWQPLEAFQLVESYEKGELKGRLKEIAATLDKEDNPVIMLIKHKESEK